MRLLLTFLLFTGVCYADDLPRKLVRTSDGQVVAWGYTDFAGTQALADYTVEVIEPRQLAAVQASVAAYRQQTLATAAQENRAKRQAAKAKLQALGLTQQDVDALSPD